MMRSDRLTVGALAKAAGVNVETIRYYHRIGLLPTPVPEYGSIRRYDRDSFKRVRFIKRAQYLGFSLDEIALLLGLADGKHCGETKRLAEKKLVVVEGKLADLAAIRNALKTMVAACGKGGGGRGCPIIDSLSEDGESAPQR